MAAWSPDGRLQLVDQRFLRVVILLRQNLSGQQICVPRQGQTRDGQLGLVLGFLGQLWSSWV